jgi:hypothetical protein
VPNLPVFTPTAVPADELAARTVGRDEVIGRLKERIGRAASSEGRPHTLVVGPRGSGKTHLLAVVLRQIECDGEVAGRVAVARLPEDSLSIASYEDLLFEVISALGGSDNAGALRAGRDGRGLERLLTRLLDGRMLLLVVENLDRVFANVGLDGQHRLRAFVETEGNTMLLATSPLLFEGVSARERPWYGSFIPEHLPDLTLDEGTELLHRVALLQGDPKLADFLVSDTGQARLRAVEHLAGGSARLWMVLAGCMTRDTLDELVPAVEALLDALAPYYQQRLWELPPNEQKLVIELCRGPGLRTVKDLASAAGLSEQVTATSLRRLGQARWVRGTKQSGTDQRTTWYEVREPLLRHHVQYRSATGEPLAFVVGFLRAWFSTDELAMCLGRLESDSPADRHVRAALAEGLADELKTVLDFWNLIVGTFEGLMTHTRDLLVTEVREELARPGGNPRWLALLLLLEPDAALTVAQDPKLRELVKAVERPGRYAVMVGLSWSTLVGSTENRAAGISLAIDAAWGTEAAHVVGLLTALGVSLARSRAEPGPWLRQWIDAMEQEPDFSGEVMVLRATERALENRDGSLTLELPPELRRIVDAALSPVLA